MIRYDRIQELANLCGKKKSYLSEAMGFSPRYLIDAKKQNTNIADKPLKILAEELKTTPEYLRGETDDQGIKETPATEGEGSDPLDIELRKIWDSSDLDDRKAILEYAHFIKSRKTK